MINIIIFYVLTIFYFTFIIYYLLKKVKQILKDNDGNSIVFTIHKVVRNILILSIFFLFVSIELLYKVNSRESIPQSNIGIALASATLIFYIMFLFRDIYLERISKYLSTNYNISLEENSFIMKGSAIIIICTSLELLNLVISIMVLAGGI